MQHASRIREEAAFDARFRDAARLIAEGRAGAARPFSTARPATAATAACSWSSACSRSRTATPTPRTIVYEHIFGPALARRWRPGAPSTPGSTRDDPDNIYIGRWCTHAYRVRLTGQEMRRDPGSAARCGCAARGDAVRSVLARDATVAVAAGHEDRGDERDCEIASSGMNSNMVQCAAVSTM